MDGLPIPENNQELEYKTQTEYAHMCGHDGHMATVLASAKALHENKSKIPKGKFVRLLFQPAEEGPGGAKPMIEEGCLNDIDEVYGFHNVPNFDEGDIRIISGSIFANSTSLTITITGQGGHGSAPHRCVHDPITATTAILNAFHSIKARRIDNRENIVFSICHIESGNTYNVFPDTATIRGTIRSYNQETKESMNKEITQISHKIAEAYNCTADVDIWDKYPAVINHEKETNHIIRLAKTHFGNEHFSQDELPMSAGEDFSYFLQERPGCFYVLGTMKEGQKL